MFSPKVEAALVYARRRHAGQHRKDGDTPYFIHLVHVAMILARAGDDDPTLVIGLLHDVLEDTVRDAEEQAAVEAEIRETWGEQVLEGVRSLSEPKRGPDGERLVWRQRKEAYLEQLAAADRRALRVSAADKHHNLETLLADLEARGPEVWSRFSGSPLDTAWYYRAVLDTLTGRLGASDALVQALSGGLPRLDAFTPE